jgi:two-component system CheB/CheR fusion protein
MPVVTATTADAASQLAPDPLLGAVRLIRARTTLDFSGYKPATIRRRMQRRMSLRHLDGMSAYVDVLRSEPAEILALSKDLMISVTSFFREPQHQIGRR